VSNEVGPPIGIPSFELLLPMPPDMGPPLPRFLGILWPWAEEKPPPGEYECPYCGEKFATYDELVAHIISAHPEERIPIDIIWTD